MVYNKQCINFLKGYGYIVMKKGLKISLAVLMTAFVIVLSSVSAFAAKEGNDSSKGKFKVKEGDTVTYTLKLGDCKDKIEGLQMYVFYGKSIFSVVEDSLVFPELDGVVQNPKYPDGIAFNWTSVTNLADFSKTKTLMQVKFKAISNADTRITYFINELYKGDKDMTSIDNYTFTCDVAVNGKKVIKNQPPVLSTDSDLNNKYQGSFINYADGKGPKNGSGKDHIMVTGVTTKPVYGDENATEVTQEGSTSATTIIVILAIVAIIVAIVIVVILRKHFVKEDAEEEIKKEE